ncbi:MAG: helix-turn-helix transcriptional regulator [Pirellulales bacterium]|nr:helix-turn-helix transcriptional regulator [Pirellulales bacterium]
MPPPFQANLQRLMAAAGFSMHDVAARSGVDERTIRGLLAGNKPHARTLHRLAEGLGVSADEFFVDPAQLLYRRFDRATNPLVEEILESQPEFFENWTEADFDELHSRFGAGGPLTREGVLESVRRMNRKRETLDKLNLLLETGEAGVLGGIIDLFYEKIRVRKGKK